MGLIAVMTLGWTWIVYDKISKTAEHHGLIQITSAVVSEAAPAAALIVLYAVTITYILDIVGGILMVTARYLTDKFVRPLIEQYRAEGRSEGLVEGRSEGEARKQREWETWNRNRIEAEENGLPFYDPPPSS